MRKLRFTSVLVTLLAAALACNPGGAVNSPAPPTRASALTTVPNSGTPSSDATPAGMGRLLLNEILFRPAQGQFQFVELKNAGTAAAPLLGLSLTNEMTQAYTLPADLDPLAPGRQLLILFDGLNRIEGNTLHTDRTDFLFSESGYVVLAAPDGTRLDHVAWGAGQPGAVRLSRGGFVPDLVPGTTIGRYPASTAVDRLDWVTFVPEQATPGAANPIPGVEILLPLSGARFEQASVILSWYPVAGAAEYRVQLASEQAFAAPQVDQTVSAPPLTVDSLAAGTYFWRVQAIEADGSVAEVSPANELTIAAPASAAHLAAPARAESLEVPYFQQHKDTRMLLLESKNETGAHAWDIDHEALDPSDSADNGNCALASIAMINAFFGGELSQDHIGYEVFKNTVPGPEWDLNYGQGLYGDQIEAALAYALGAKPIAHAEPASADVLWNVATAEIDAGRPILASVPGHAIVITGYYEGDAVHWISVNDPWDGQYAVDLSLLGIVHYWLLPHEIQAASDEPELHQDSDGDGIVDFDETHRFHTGPGDPDSDQDKVQDKIEIRTSVFDPNHGYSAGPEGHQDGRNFDRDGQPMELDEDSDAGGCFDGLEDVNFDGQYQADQHETYNFDDQDDPCVFGTYEIVKDVVDVAGTFPEVLMQRNWGLFAKFSVRVTAGAVLDGLARVSMTSYGEEISGPCTGSEEIQEPDPLEWGATLKGDYRKNADGSVSITFAAEPQSGPEYTVTSTAAGECKIDWVSSYPPGQSGLSYFGGMSGKLVNGHSDVRIDGSVGSNESGEVYSVIHIEQSAGFPGFP